MVGKEAASRSVGALAPVGAFDSPHRARRSIFPIHHIKTAREAALSELGLCWIITTEMAPKSDVRVSAGAASDNEVESPSSRAPQAVAEVGKATPTPARAAIHSILHIDSLQPEKVFLDLMKLEDSQEAAAPSSSRCCCFDTASAPGSSAWCASKLCARCDVLNKLRQCESMGDSVPG